MVGGGERQGRSSTASNLGHQSSLNCKTQTHKTNFNGNGFCT